MTDEHRPEPQWKDHERAADAPSADDVSADDPHKTERLTKAGRPIDPDTGAD